MFLTPETRGRLLRGVALSEGYDSVDDMLEAVALDSICPGCCVSPDCEAPHDCTEPDQDCGICEICERGTVQSVLIIAQLI